MKSILFLTIVCVSTNLVYGFTKYGRTCKDIGCGRNEECVMQEDPCSYYQRENECGKYPTCRRVSSNNDCTGYICPPTKMCRVEGGNPKCVDDPNASSSNGKQYKTENRQQSSHSNSDNPPNYPPPAPPRQNYPSNPAYNPNYPSGGNNYPSGGNNYPYNNNNHGIYPQIPGQTTPRPYRPAYPNSGGGYQGGSIGSGYPGGSVGSGYPGQRGNYPQGYPGYNQGNRNPYQTNPYGNNYGNNYNRGTSGSSGSLDSITDTLKSIGTKILADAIVNKLAGTGQQANTNNAYNNRQQPQYNYGQNGGNAYYPSQGESSSSSSGLVDKIKSIGGDLLKDYLTSKKN